MLISMQNELREYDRVRIMLWSTLISDQREFFARQDSKVRWWMFFIWDIYHIFDITKYQLYGKTIKMQEKHGVEFENTLN